MTRDAVPLAASMTRQRGISYDKRPAIPHASNSPNYYVEACLLAAFHLVILRLMTDWR